MKTLQRKHSERLHASWTLADFNDRKRGRLALIHNLLDRRPDMTAPPAHVELRPWDGKPRRQCCRALKPTPAFAE